MNTKEAWSISPSPQVLTLMGFLVKSFLMCVFLRTLKVGMLGHHPPWVGLHFLLQDGIHLWILSDAGIPLNAFVAQGYNISTWCKLLPKAYYYESGCAHWVLCILRMRLVLMTYEQCVLAGARWITKKQMCCGSHFGGFVCAVITRAVVWPNLMEMYSYFIGKPCNLVESRVCESFVSEIRASRRL